jgi:putative acetyltransferase
MEINWRPADDPAVLALTAAQQDELNHLAPDADAVRHALHAEIEFAVGSVDGEAVACGALQRLTETEAEIKRVYVTPAARRSGLARQIVAAIEIRAAERHFAIVRLETGTTYQSAISLYSACGYARVPAYGEYIGNPYSACFAKRLAAHALA